MTPAQLHAASEHIALEQRHARITHIGIHVGEYTQDAAILYIRHEDNGDQTHRTVVVRNWDDDNQKWHTTGENHTAQNLSDAITQLQDRMAELCCQGALYQTRGK